MCMNDVISLGGDLRCAGNDVRTEGHTSGTSLTGGTIGTYPFPHTVSVREG